LRRSDGTCEQQDGMTHSEAREFIRKHFEEFVNKKNVEIGNVNFAANFVDHGSDVPPGMPPGPAGAIAYVGGALKRFPDLACDDRGHDCGGRSGGGAESLDGYRFADGEEVAVSWNCELADRGTADCGAVGVLGNAACGGVGRVGEKRTSPQRH
jgi:hypothetical protein